jgi:hypothetical protein
MRVPVPFSALSIGLLICGTACAGPHSTGALWSQQYVEQERPLFAMSDAQRQAQAQAFEFSLADEALGAESQRIQAAMEVCPGPVQAWRVSPDDRLRDDIRVRAQPDTERIRQVSQLALADWYLRRASTSGDARFCEQARMALSATPDSPAQASLLDGLPAAIVSRDNRPATAATPRSSEAPVATVSRYALGSVDAVQAPAPLPQYLALVYGGFLNTPADAIAPIDAEAAAALVDQQAPAYPDWEPDALYAALRGGQP